MPSALDYLEEFLCKVVLNPPAKADKRAKRKAIAMRDTVSFLGKMLKADYNELTDEGEPDIDSLVTAVAAATAFLSLTTLGDVRAEEVMAKEAAEYLKIFAQVSTRYMVGEAVAAAKAKMER